MKKILSVFILTLILISPAYASTSYFSTSGSNTTGDGSQSTPWQNFSGKKSSSGALSCGDIVRLKRGDTWTGSSAEVIVDSGTTSCTESTPIVIEAYGTGANPILAGAAVTTAGWSVHSGSIYKILSQSQTHLKTVTQDDNKALGWWSGTNTTLPAGTFRRESTTLYVHLWNDADPSTSSVRIASFAQTEDANGSRGLLSAGKRSSGSGKGHHVRFRDITIIGSNGVGFSTSGTYTKTAGLSIVGAGGDGMLGYSDLTGSLENSDHWEDFGSTVTYSAAGANGGTGFGQGYTTYSSYCWFFKSISNHNFMAGFDFLNFGPSTNVTESGCLWCSTYLNGTARSDPSYDPGLYSDGGTKIFVYGLTGYGGGTGSGTAGNSRAGVSFGSEHGTSDPMNDNYLINSLVYGTHWEAFNTANADGTNTNKNVTLAYDTLVAYDAGVFDMVLHFANKDTTADNFKMRNNILVSDSAYVDSFMDSGTYLDSDNNLYYRRGNASTSTDIYHTCSGCAGTNLNLAGWRTASGEDASSSYGDPLFVTDSDTALDAHLGAGSPAIDLGMTSAYTVPSWLPTTIKNYLGTAGIRGSTRASGAIDNYASAPDAGFHYDYPDLTSTNVQPASLIQSVAGNVTISFTIPDPMGWIPYNGKIKITMPAGFTINSGGTTAISSVSGISGTFTVAVSSQDITITRVGDGQSEFPGDFSFILSNILNPSSTGSTSAYSIYVLDSSSNIIAQDTAVTADTILSNGGGGGAAATVTDSHFSCRGFIGKGFTIA